MRPIRDLFGTNFTMVLYILRSAISTALFSVFGYACPALNSVKAVVSEDIDSIREYMTYWVVLSIFMGIGSLLDAVNFFKHYSPEMKVIFVMWLTLPRFQGAYRIYTLFLRCFYSRYEDEIDQKVDEISGKIRSKIWQKFKMVCWILFISSNDSLLSSAGSNVKHINILVEAMNVVQKTWMTFTGSSSASGIDGLEINKADSSAELSTGRTAKDVLGNQSRLLNEFVIMMERSIFLDVACTAGGEEGDEVPSMLPFTPCRLSLSSTNKNNSRVLEVRADSAADGNVRFSMDESLDLMMQADMEEEARAHGSTSFCEAGAVRTVICPLALVRTVDELEFPRDDGRCVVLEAKLRGVRHVLVVRATDPEEGQALSVGLEVLITDERSRGRRKKRPLRGSRAI